MTQPHRDHKSHCPTGHSGLPARGRPQDAAPVPLGTHWTFYVGAVLVAYLSFRVPGEVLSVVGSVVLPATAVTLATWRRPGTARQAAVAGARVGAVYGVARSAVTQVQYFALGGRQIAYPAATPVPPVNALDLGAAILTIVTLMVVYVMIAAVAGYLAFKMVRIARARTRHASSA